MPRYSIVVPVYNEAANIEQFCVRVVNELPADGELLVVYDFDEDDTLTALARLAPEHTPAQLRTVRNNLGPGVRNAIVAGMRAATAPVVLVMMADLSDDFSCVPTMIERVEAGADVVCASRYMRGGRQLGGGFKKALSRTAGVSLHAIGALPVHDPTNSFKAYRREFLERVTIESEKGFALAMELTVKAHRSGGRVEEVPATWTDRVAGESRFRLREWIPVYLRWYVLALAQQRVFWNLLTPLTILLAAGAIVPLRRDTNMRTEYSFLLALHDAFLRHLRFGHDIVFTYGPWGLLLGGEHPDTIALTISIRLLIVILTSLLLRRMIARRAPSAIATTMIAGLAVIAHICDADTFFLFVPLLLLLEALDRNDARPNVLYMTTIAAGALLGLAKFSLLTLMFVVVAIASVDELRRRTVPASGITYVLATAALWIAGRQQMSDFPSFLRTSAELSSGYGEAMQKISPLYAHALLPLLIAMIAFTIVAALVEMRRSPLRGALFSAGWLAAALIVFKSAFVRADFFHIAPACGALLLIQLCHLTLRIRDQSRVTTAVSVIAILVSFVNVGAFIDRGFFLDTIDTVGDSSLNIARMLDWPAFHEDTRRFHASFVQSEPALTIASEGDMIPAPSPIAFQNSFGYRHRPVFIGYAVYTPALSDINVAWLRRNRPTTLLFDIDPIDRRFPSLEDGALWPILLSEYSLSSSIGSHLVLTRRDTPLRLAIAPAVTLVGRIGERIVLPRQEDELRFARIQIGLTQRGTLERLLYKTPVLRIHVGLEDGSEKSYRFIRGMAERDFLLSPLVESRADFAQLADGKGIGKRVVWMKIESDGTASYAPRFRMEVRSWRREWDSNPRYAVNVHTLSKRAP